MSNYTQTTNFATKDALASGNPLKIVKGTEINTEFANIAIAVATKLDGSGGTVAGATITTSTIDSSTIGATTPSTGAFTTLSATGITTLSNAVLPVIDNIKLGYTTTATAAGTTTLTSASNNQQFFTGSTTQTVVLPVTSTLALGLSYLIVNNSTGVVTVQSSGANTITLIPAGAAVRCTCILITGTTAASWSFAFESSSNIPYKQIPTITATVATNILTLGLNPCSLDFRSSTASSGTTTTRNVTAAISMTVSNGSTLGTVSAVASKLAVLAIDNAGTVELAVVNANYSGLLDERSLISTTAEGGTGTADSGAVIYSTTARTNVSFRIIGYVESTQATAGAWATSPSNIAGMGGAIVPQSTQQYYRLNADLALASSSSALNPFGVSCTLSANTVYEFEIVFALSRTTGAVSHTVSINFTGGTATLNNIAYFAQGFSSASASAIPTYVLFGSSAAGIFSGIVSTSASTVVTSATSGANEVISLMLKGTVSVNAAGTFFPQYICTAAPGGGFTTVAGSYIKINPLSASGAATNVGSWA
jgi:hypothetical protein